MMRRFHLQRHVDSTGTSGTGRVAEGVQFSSGWVALTWMSPYTTVAVYANIEVVQHLHGHGGNTKVVWEDASLYSSELMEPAVPPQIAQGAGA